MEEDDGGPLWADSMDDVVEVLGCCSTGAAFFITVVSCLLKS